MSRCEDIYSHNTLLDLRKVLSAIFAQAAEWKLWQGENPCWRLKGEIGGKAKVFPKKLPKTDSLQRFLGALEDTCIIPTEGARLLVVTSIAIGTRVSEVLALQPGDIDADAETITIQRGWARGRIGPTKTPESERTRQAPERHSRTTRIREEARHRLGGLHLRPQGPRRHAA